ncbi:hypothetical protein [Mycoplasmopsis arginini]|uniref:Lipoprotein n=1 Tax=Mycoplasmopsis arginini TaxID=2094 RepID=A0AA43U1W9_MYCAR|nr:hypothetical protein [Mycoplasmopsis arginini]MDI3349837.1 hypothetical protein [Mycoplasmopsis arginini]
MKKSLLIFLILLWGCSKPDLPEPEEVVTNDYIFNSKESTILNGQTIYFQLQSDGVYFLTLTDKETGQIISREKFNGKMGENIKRIYTNSLQSQYLYLTLQDVNKVELGKTIIIKK